MLDKEKQIRAKGKLGKETEDYHHGWYHSRTKNINNKKVQETKYHIDCDTKANSLFGWKRSVGEKAPAIISIISLILSLAFLSSNLTGYTISNIDQSSSNIVAGVFFLLGIIAAFFYYKIR